MILLPTILFRSLLAFILCYPLASQAQTAIETKIAAIESVFTDAQWAIQGTYRKSIASALADADKVEVFLLDFETQDGDMQLPENWGRDFFLISPYDTISKILKTKVLSAEEIKKLVPVLRDTVAVEKNPGGALCHYPIHGVRLWKGSTLIFESSFCWVCANFYVRYPDRTADWMGMKDRALENIMTELLPIPTQEIERFDAMRKGKKK